MRLNEEDSVACIALKATKYKPDKKTPVIYPWCSSELRTSSKINLLAFFLVVVEYYNCYSDVSSVFNKILIISMLFLKLSLLNKHRILISYLNRLPAFLH
jgi:hypothetical protein